MRGAVPGYAAYATQRSWTPLALTLGLHLLLVLAWLTGARGGRVPETPQRAFTFVLVQPPARPKPAPELPPPLPPPLPLPRSRVPASTHVPTPVVPVPAATPYPDADTASAPQAEPAPVAADALPAPGTAVPGALLKSSRAMAGRVDRELRNGSSPITAEPERKWERFAQAFAAARTSRGYAMTLESYTDPDGTIIYRKTIGGRKSCYRSGSVGGLVTGFGNADGRGAGYTPCPTGVSWTRH